MTSFDPFEVSPAHVIYVGLGFFIVIFGMLSLFIKERLYMGEAPLALIFGIIVGPAVANVFNPVSWGEGPSAKPPGGHVTDEVTLEVMRVTIALSVFAVGVELPKKYLLRHWRSIAMLLGPVMVWGWLITAAFICALVPGIDFLNSLVIAACVTPTDPILAQAVVGGPWAEKHVPAHLRHMLQCESGCNDGAAFPFLYLALFLTTTRGNMGKGIAEWFYDALAYQIIFGTILGALIGWAARKAMRFSERKRLVDRESFVAQYVSLAIASMGVNVLLGSDDLLAAFACGTAFAWDGWFTKQTEDSNFSNIVDLLFNTATFIYIGALMPWYEFAHAADSLNVWRCIVLAIAVLLLKRIPIILALWRWIPDIKTFREAMFSGHFGPIGVGAIFIATLGRYELPEEIPNPPETSNDVLALTIQPIVFFLVLCSVAVHGLTVPFFAFSKRATTLTRTWSRNPSFADGGEPGWINRLKRYATGDTMRSVSQDGGGDGMTEIQRVLNAQLGVIGKGAIGGDAEKQLRGGSLNDPNGEGSGDDSSGSRTRVGLLNTRTERDLELAEGDINEKVEKAPQGDSSRRDGQTSRKKDDYDDVDDWEADEIEDPSCEWGGHNTAEMKLFQAKRAERSEARRKQREQEQSTDNGDMGEAPMDREMISGQIHESEEDEDVRKDKEGHDPRHKDKLSQKEAEELKSVEKVREEEECYPKARSWLEGNSLVIEYMESRSSEPDVRVVELAPEEAEQISRCSQDEQYTVASAWLESHREEMDHHIEDGSHREWHPAETARKLIATGALQLWLKSGHNDRNSRGMESKKGITERDQPHEETEQERRERASMIYQALNWRQEEGEDDKDDSSLAVAKGSSPTSFNRQDEAIDSSSSRSSAEAISSVPRSSHTPYPPRSKSPPMNYRKASGDVRLSHARQHLAAGGRRSSMRRKILAGKVYLGGQDTGSEQDESAEDFVDEEPSSQDSRYELKENTSYGVLRSPDDLQKVQSAGNRTPSASVSFLDTGDTRHDRVDGAPSSMGRRPGSYRRRKDMRDHTRDGQRPSVSQLTSSEEGNSKRKALHRSSSAASASGSGSNNRSAPQSLPAQEGPTTLTLASPDEEPDDSVNNFFLDERSGQDKSGSKNSSSNKNRKVPGRLSAFLSSLTSSSGGQLQTSSQGGRAEDSFMPEPSQSPDRSRRTSGAGIQAFQLPTSSAANEIPEVLTALSALNRDRGAGGQETPVSSGSATPGPRSRTHLEADDGPSEGILNSPSPERDDNGTATPNEGSPGNVSFAPTPSTV